MNHTLSLILLTLVVPIQVSAVPLPECGPNSLMTICDYRGVTATFEEICRLSEYNETFGTTLLGLYKAAMAKGLSVSPVKMTIDDLRKGMTPAIVFVDSNHFFVVLEYRNGTFMIEDRPLPIFYITPEDLGKRWDGTALVFNKGSEKKDSTDTKKSALGGLVFDTYVNHFGSIKEGTILTHTFSYRNAGDETISITTRPSCYCATAALSKKTIKPGESGELFVEYNTKGRKGSNKIQVHVNAKGASSSSTLFLILTSVIKEPVKAEPPFVDLGSFRKNEKISRTLYITDTGEGLLRLVKVGTTPGITASIKAPDRFPTRKLPVTIDVKTSALGLFEGTVTVETNDPLTPSITVPVKGVVVGEIEAYPSRIFIANVPVNNRAEKTVKLINADTVKIGAAVCSNPCLSAQVTQSRTEGKHLIVTVRTPGSACSIRDSVAVYLADKKTPELVIPVFVKVTE